MRPCTTPTYAASSAGVVLACVLSMAAGCAARQAPAEPSRASAPPLMFDLDGPQRSELDSAATRGRTTVILFGTTYDLATQVQAKQLEAVLHLRRPRMNVGMIVLETSEYAPMAAAFQSSLGLSYPVLIADETTRRGHGVFGSFARIPTLVVLDAAGRLRSRSEGLIEPAELEALLDAAATPDHGESGASR